MSTARSVARSVACWLGLHDPDAVPFRGWRAWWAPVLWWSAAALLVLSWIRFLANPLICLENGVIAVVFVLFFVNAERLRELLSAPASMADDEDR